MAGLQLLPNFKESDYLISLQERQRYPDAKDFMLDFLNQVWYRLQSCPTLLTATGWLLLDCGCH